MAKVVVLDYGSGNVHSAVKALEAAGAEVELTGDRRAALEADGLLVPGVGAFPAVMDALNAARGGSIVLDGDPAAATFTLRLPLAEPEPEPARRGVAG